MFEAVITTLSLVSIVLSACFIVFLYKFKAGLPDFQQIFDEFGEVFIGHLAILFL